jgi:hypothetical protein
MPIADDMPRPFFAGRVVLGARGRMSPYIAVLVSSRRNVPDGGIERTRADRRGLRPRKIREARAALPTGLC